MKFPHTHFRRGQRVRIVTRDGGVRVRRFVDRIARAIVVANCDTGIHEHIATAILRNVSIFKQK